MGFGVEQKYQLCPDCISQTIATLFYNDNIIAIH